MFARTESKAPRIRIACGPPSSSTTASLASRIFPPNALPRITSCTKGKIMDASISAGERKNLRISRSTIAIIRFINSISSGSWLQPRPLWHYEGVRFLQFVAQLPAGVMHEYVVQRRVLHGKRLHRNPGSDGHLDEFRGGSRSVAGEDSIHASAFMLHRGDVVHGVQALLPIFRRVLELRFDHVRAGHTRL